MKYKSFQYCIFIKSKHHSENIYLLDAGSIQNLNICIFIIKCNRLLICILNIHTHKLSNTFLCFLSKNFDDHFQFIAIPHVSTHAVANAKLNQQIK